MPFEEFLGREMSNRDFVYMDPPYAPENKTSFVGYNACGFDEDAHKKLFRVCTTLDAGLVMSNSDVDLVKCAFSDEDSFCLHTVECKRRINSKKPESVANELIIEKV